jgi:hypothetical protein
VELGVDCDGNGSEPLGGGVETVEEREDVLPSEERLKGFLRRTGMDRLDDLEEEEDVDNEVEGMEADVEGCLDRP